MKLFIVLGLGQLGRHTAMTLFSGGGDVLAVDKSEERVELIKDSVGQAVCADATNINTLSAIGAANADTAVIAFGEAELEESILACSALSDLGCGRIVVRSSSALHGKILTRVGASKVVYPEKQIGEQLAKSLLVSGVLEQRNLSFNNLKEMLIKILDDNVELSLKKENMFKNDSKNTLLKIEKEIEKLILCK